MKTILRTAIAVVGFGLGTSCGPFCFGQAPSATPPVVVVDIGYLFKNHTRFKQTMDRMKQEVKANDEQFRARAKDIETRMQRLEAYKSDSADYKKLEAETARLQAQIQADMALKRKEFLQREAKIYYDIHQEIQKEVKAFADNHGVGLVLRFSADEIDSSDRESVLQGINRPVVYQRNLNITYNILDRLQRAQESPRTAKAPTHSTSSGPQPGASESGTGSGRAQAVPRR